MWTVKIRELATEERLPERLLFVLKQSNIL
jgi:hypothetical protein